MQEEYLSLYNYLGRAAGMDLGKEVYVAAVSNGIKPKTRSVSNPKYKGIVKLYPKSFLVDFFNQKRSQTQEETDLPF